MRITVVDIELRLRHFPMSTCLLHNAVHKQFSIFPSTLRRRSDPCSLRDNMSLFDAIHSQRAIRHFSAQPVSDDAVETMLHAAIRAPSGGNRQPWRFM